MPVSPKSNDPVGILDGYTTKEDYTPSEDEKELVNRFYNLLQRCVEHKLPYVRSWEIMRAMIDGYQMLAQHTLTGDYIRVIGKSVQKRLHSINNKLQPAARSLHGKLVRLRPSFTSIPMSGDQDDIQAAMVDDAFIAYHDQRHNMMQIWSEACMYKVYNGNGIIQLKWDENGGRVMAYCEQCSYKHYDETMIGAECPDCSAKAFTATQMHAEADQMAMTMGEAPAPAPDIQVPLLVRAMEGEEKPFVVPMESVYIDPSCVDIRDAQYVIVKHLMSVTAARKRWPEKADYIAEDQSLIVDDLVSRTYNLDTGVWTNPQLEDTCVVYEFHEVPTALHPKGRVVYVSNQIVLDEKEELFYDDFGRLPFFHLIWWKYPRKLFGQGPAEQAVSRQRELNEYETNMREYIELVAKPRVFAWRGSISPDEMTSKTGQVVSVSQGGGGFPQVIVPPNMPQSVFERKESLIGDIREALSITDAEAGLSSDSTGRAMAILQAEGDQQVVGMTTYNSEEMKEYYRCVLTMVKKLRDPEWKFSIMGDFGLEVYSFEGRNGQSMIYLEQDDGLSSNKAVRLQEVMNLISVGVLTDQTTGMVDQKAVSRLLKIKLPQQGFDAKASEYIAAQAVIKKVEDGQIPVQLEVVDDPAIFAETFMHWLRTKGRLPSVDMNVKAEIERLYMVCTFTIRQAAMQQAQAAQPQPGQVGASNAQTQSSQGGSPNKDQNALAGGGIAGNANETVKQADKAGEAQARGGAKHENGQQG